MEKTINLGDFDSMEGRWFVEKARFISTKLLQELKDKPEINKVTVSVDLASVLFIGGCLRFDPESNGDHIGVIGDSVSVYLDLNRRSFDRDFSKIDTSVVLSEDLI